MPSLFSPNAHCSYCGRAYAPGQPWPRLCPRCGNTSFLNPLPVVVMLVPIEGGLLVVRRGIEPGWGKLALPGGYLGLDESWQAAGAREVYEATGVTIQADGVRAFAVRSTGDGVLLVFGLALPVAAPPEFRCDAETHERVILRAPAELAFPAHTEVAAAYFGRNGL